VKAMAHPVTNFCKQEEMSICTADCQKQQADCSFYEKSQHANRCMYFIFDEYCDSLKAQMNSAAMVATSRY
jgi:RNA-binding protein YlmH